jgi:hypothetical protein
MRFQEAKDKLKELAKGQMHSLEFSLTEHKNGAVMTKCYLFLMSPDTQKGIGKAAETWDKAFALIEAELMPDGEEEVPEDL